MDECRICGRQGVVRRYCVQCEDGYRCHRCGDIAKRDLKDGLCPACVEVEDELDKGAFCHSCPCFEIDTEDIPHRGNGDCHLWPFKHEKSDGDWCAQHPRWKPRKTKADEAAEKFAAIMRTSTMRKPC